MNDDLQVLVVDADALRAVHIVNAVHNVELCCAWAEDAKDLLWIDRTFHQLGTGGDVLAVLDQQWSATGHLVGDVLHARNIRGENDVTAILVLLNVNSSVVLGDRRLALRSTSLEELRHTRKTLSDIGCRSDATRVEGTQGQLRTRLADGLCCDDADCLANINQVVGCQGPTVALGAHATLGFAGQHGANLDGGNAVLDEHSDDVHIHCGVALGQNGGLIAWINDILSEHTRVSRGICELVDAQGAVVVALGDRDDDTLLGAAILFAHDHILGNVDQTTGEVTRLCRTKCGISQALTSAVLGDEVLQGGQAIVVVGLDWTRNDVALRVRHEATHCGDLTNLHPVTTCTRAHHDVQVVVRTEVLFHLGSDFIGALRPCIDDFLTALGFGEHTHLVLLVDLLSQLIVTSNDGLALWRGDDVGEGHGHAGPLAVVEAEVLQSIEGCVSLGDWIVQCNIVDDWLELVLRNLLVDEWIVNWQGAVEQDTAVGGSKQEATILQALFLHHFWHSWLWVNDLDLAWLPVLGWHKVLWHAEENQSVHGNLTGIEGHTSLRNGGEDATLALLAFLNSGQPVQTQNHILRWHGHHVAICWLEQVVGSEHEGTSLSLCLNGKRQMDCHLVAIEVGVEWCAGQWWQVNCVTFHQDWLEGLNGEAVQGRCTVEQHWVLGDDLLQHVPDVGVGTVDQALGALDVLCVAFVHQTLDDEWLVQLECHWLWHAALMHAQAWAHDDHGTARVIHTLTQKVLAETTLLALEHVGQGLQWTVRSAGHGTTTTAIVEEGINSFLKHALLVVEHDLWCAELDQTLQTVVTVDHTTVEIIEVGGCEAAAVQLDHRTQIRWDNRDGVENHCCWAGAGVEECVHNLQALESASLALAGASAHDFTKLLIGCFEVEIFQTLLDGFCTHRTGEVIAVAIHHLAPQVDITFHIAWLEALEAIPHALQTTNLVVEAVADGLQFTVGSALELGRSCGLALACFQVREVLFQLALAVGELDVATLGHGIEVGV